VPAVIVAAGSDIQLESEGDPLFFGLFPERKLI